MGHRPEADRRRSAEPRRRARVQRARAGSDAQADRRSGGVVRPARRDGRQSARARDASITELFRLAIGGYGLFGIITRVQLRLRPRVKVERVVTLGDTADIMERFEQRIRDGYLYGDFQFATDDTRDSFLRRGVFSCYRPVDAATPLTENPTRFHPDDWARLTRYSHTNKRLAFDFYTFALPRDVRTDLLVGRAALGGLRRRLPRRPRPRDGCARQGLGDDHGDLRRTGAGWPRSWKTRARPCAHTGPT